MFPMPLDAEALVSLYKAIRPAEKGERGDV